MREFLFDVSWWPPTLLAVVGIILLVWANRRQLTAPRNAGALVALLGVLWLVLSFVVQTPRKICEKLARQAVGAIADSDWKSFDDLLVPGADARFVGRPWRVYGREAVDATAKMIVKNAGLHSAGVSRVHSSRQDSTVTVSFTAFIDSELTPGHPIDSDWEFDFRAVADQWLIQEIRVLRVDATDPEGIRESLNRH